MPPPTVEDIDQLLAAWDERLRKLDDLLLALESDATYRMLAGVYGRRGPLDGATAARVHPTLDALELAMQQRARLTEVVDHARALRMGVSTLTFWDNERKLIEARTLLEGPSLTMGLTPTVVTPGAARSGATRELATEPERLFASVRRAYDSAREVVTAVARAWAVLEPQAETLSRRVAELRAQATAVGSNPPELTQLESALTALRTRVARDPLGLVLATVNTGGLEASLAPQLTAVQNALGDAGAMRERTTSSLRRAADALTRINALHRDAHAAAERWPQEFEAPDGAPSPVDDALIEALSPWLERLRGSAEQGRLAAADAGLAQWFAAAKSYLATDRAVIDGLDALLASRAELRGKLTTLRARAQGLAVRGIMLKPQAEGLGREADALLRQRPTPMARAASLLRAYEAAVDAADQS